MIKPGASHTRQVLYYWTVPHLSHFFAVHVETEQIMAFSSRGNSVNLPWHLLGRQSIAIESTALGALKLHPSYLVSKRSSQSSDAWKTLNQNVDSKAWMYPRITQGHWTYGILGSGEVRNQAIVLQCTPVLGGVLGTFLSPTVFQTLSALNLQAVILKLLDRKPSLDLGITIKVLYIKFFGMQFQDSQTPSSLHWITGLVFFFLSLIHYIPTAVSFFKLFLVPFPQLFFSPRSTSPFPFRKRASLLECQGKLGLTRYSKTRHWYF